MWKNAKCMHANSYEIPSKEKTIFLAMWAQHTWQKNKYPQDLKPKIMDNQLHDFLRFISHAFSLRTDLKNKRESSLSDSAHNRYQDCKKERYVCYKREKEKTGKKAPVYLNRGISPYLYQSFFITHNHLFDVFFFRLKRDHKDQNCCYYITCFNLAHLFHNINEVISNNVKLIAQNGSDSAWRIKEMKNLYTTIEIRMWCRAKYCSQRANNKKKMRKRRHCA